MKEASDRNHIQTGCPRLPPQADRAPGADRRGFWLTVGSKILGLAALAWVLFRSGSKPTRLSYPCQQSALGLAVGAYGVPLVGACMAARSQRAGRRSPRAFVLPGTLLLVAASILILEQAASWRSDVADSPMAMLVPPADYHPDVFLVNNARGVDADRFGGIDDLITLMEHSGRKFYRSNQEVPTMGPDGLIAADSVVLVKINAQWAQRGGTNTDVLSGVLRRIVEHPDGFTGEIVVADNGQGYGSLTRPFNNATDTSQSVRTVVDRLAAQGWSVSTYLWDNIRTSQVGEYSDGDLISGYVVDAEVNAPTGIRVSYPKFRTIANTWISYKFGIWTPASATYDAPKLVVINLPVLKTHQIYGVTAAVKNHMGVVTQSLGTDSHGGVGRGGLGSVLALVRRPDLTILDGVWVLARPGSGPSADYSQATRCDKLLAGSDPAALDAWAVKFVLLPKIIANGYTQAQYFSLLDPDNPNSTFRRYLDRSTAQLLAVDIPATVDYRAVRLHAWSNDVDADGDLDLDDFVALEECLSGPTDLVTPECEGSDFDLNGAADLRDLAHLQRSFTGPVQP